MTIEKKPVGEHLRSLYDRVVRVEKALETLREGGTASGCDPDVLIRLSALEERLNGGGTWGENEPKGTAGQFPFDKEVLIQVVDLETRLQQVERENRRLNDLCGTLRDENQAISNLYIAKHRLHASFDANEVLRIVSEILVELVGAQAFSICFFDRRKHTLRRIAGRGPDAILGDSVLPLGHDEIGEAARGGKAFYASPDAGDSSPLAVMPLSSDGGTMGIIAIYRLVPHKTQLSPIDHQLLELVAEHAPRALLSAYLHGKKRHDK